MKKNLVVTMIGKNKVSAAFLCLKVNDSLGAKCEFKKWREKKTEENFMQRRSAHEMKTKKKNAHERSTSMQWFSCIPFRLFPLKE